MALDILVVDDERDIRELVSGVLSDEGYECRTAGDSNSALAMFDERRPSVVLLDVWLHGSAMDGLEVLDVIKEREPDIPVIIFSGHGNIDTAVSAVGRGAMDFIEKPFEATRLLHLVSRATETQRLRRGGTGQCQSDKREQRGEDAKHIAAVRARVLPNCQSNW